VAEHCWPGQVRQEATVDGTRQEVGLQGEGAGIGGRQLLAQQGQVSSRRPTPKWQASLEQVFSSQDAVAASIAADVVLGERRWRSTSGGRGDQRRADPTRSAACPGSDGRCVVRTAGNRATRLANAWPAASGVVRRLGSGSGTQCRRSRSSAWTSRLDLRSSPRERETASNLGSGEVAPGRAGVVLRRQVGKLQDHASGLPLAHGLCGTSCLAPRRRQTAAVGQRYGDFVAITSCRRWRPPCRSWRCEWHYPF